MKTTTKVFLVIVLTIIIGAVVVWILNSEKSETLRDDQDVISNEEEQTEELDDLQLNTNLTNNLSYKTYRNDKFDFEFQYNSNHELGSITNNDTFTSFSFIDSKRSSLSVYKNVSKSLESFIEDKRKDYLVGESSQIILGGEPAYELVGQGMDNYYELLVKKGDNIYDFTFNTNSTETLDNLKAGLNDNQKMIISTFKFLE